MARRKEENGRRHYVLDVLGRIPPTRERDFFAGVTTLDETTVSLAAHVHLGERSHVWIGRIAITRALINSFSTVEESPVPERYKPSLVGRDLKSKQPFVYIHGSRNNRIPAVGVLTQIGREAFQTDADKLLLRQVVESTLKLSTHNKTDLKTGTGNLIRIKTDELIQAMECVMNTPAKGKSPSILLGYAIGTPFICATFVPEADEYGLLPTRALDQSRLEKELFDYWTRVRQKGNDFLAGIEIDELCAILNFLLVKRLRRSSSTPNQSESPYVNIINPNFVAGISLAPKNYYLGITDSELPRPVIAIPLFIPKPGPIKRHSRQLRV